MESVRLGLEPWVTGRRVAGVDVLHPRSVRRQTGPTLASALVGSTLLQPCRRGKFLWIPLDSRDGDQSALVAHLGMSGQFRIQPADAPDEAHLRVRLRFDDDGPQVRFLDQRMFGGLHVDDLVDDGLDDTVPASAAHIALDLLDPRLDQAAVARRVRSRRTAIKRVLLDQTLVSGIGNIYADEALWRCRIHYDRAAGTLTQRVATDLLDRAREVMTEALAEGGTSFDALYVRVNGESGYFDRSLAAYGRAGEPCPRCGRAIVREPFMNRSSFRCPRCQRAPRR